MRLDKGQDCREHFFSMAAVAAYGRYCQLRKLPTVELPDLGRRDLEFRPDSAEQAMNHLALRLQRPAFGQVKDNLGDAYRH